MLRRESLFVIKLTHRPKTHSDDFNVCCRNVWTLSCAGRRNPKTTLLALTTTGHKPPGEHVHIFIRWMRVSRDFCPFFHLGPMNGAMGNRLGKNGPAASWKRRQIFEKLFPCIVEFLSHAISPFLLCFFYVSEMMPTLFIWMPQRLFFFDSQVLSSTSA